MAFTNSYTYTDRIRLDLHCPNWINTMPFYLSLINGNNMRKTFLLLVDVWLEYVY